MGYRDLGVVTLLIKILAYRIADAMLRDLPTDRERRNWRGDYGGGPKLSVAFINAAAIAG